MTRQTAIPAHEPLAPLVEAVARAMHGPDAPRPFVVAVGGGVAAGKSSLAAILADALRRRGRTVEVVAADGFLRPNAELAARGLMDRKGHPESFDEAALRAFFAQVRGGAARLAAPVYSHETYDVEPARAFDAPDALVFEGVNALAWPSDYGVYVEVDEAEAEAWYVARFLALRRHEAPRLAERLAAAGGDPQVLARAIWREVNLTNLRRHIAPTRDRADAVVEKGPDHAVRRVSLR